MFSCFGDTMNEQCGQHNRELDKIMMERTAVDRTQEVYIIYNPPREECSSFSAKGL